MTSFATTPGNSRHDVLRDVLASPVQRVQRIMQVTRAYWWPAEREEQPRKPAYGPGGRPLKLELQA